MIKQQEAARLYVRWPILEDQGLHRQPNEALFAWLFIVGCQEAKSKNRINTDHEPPPRAWGVALSSTAMFQII